MKDYEIICEIESYDEWEWEHQVDVMVHTLEELFTFPVQMEAESSDWRGQTGYANADEPEEVINKSLSFGNDWISLRRNDQGYYIRTASHDVPTGFNIYKGLVWDENTNQYQ